MDREFTDRFKAYNFKMFQFGEFELSRKLIFKFLIFDHFLILLLKKFSFLIVYAFGFCLSIFVSTKYIYPFIYIYLPFYLSIFNTLEFILLCKYLIWKQNIQNYVKHMLINFQRTCQNYFTIPSLTTNYILKLSPSQLKKNNPGTEKKSKSCFKVKKQFMINLTLQYS